MPSRSCHHRLISWWATTGGRETKSFGIIHAAASRRWWWRVWALQSASDVDRHRFVCSHMPCSSASGSAAPRLAQVWPAGSDKPPSASAAPQCVHRVISQRGQGGVRQLLAVSISGWLLRSRWHALDAWLHKSVRTGPRSLSCLCAVHKSDPVVLSPLLKVLSTVWSAYSTSQMMVIKLWIEESEMV